jgi:hypothetical protein
MSVSVSGGIDVDRNLAAPHDLIVICIDTHNLSGHLRRDVHDVGIYEGIVCVFILALDEPPDKPPISRTTTTTILNRVF